MSREMIKRMKAGLDWLDKQPDKLAIGDLVFVYGTLKQGFHNHYLLRGVKFVGNAVTVDKWALPIYGGTHLPTVLPLNDGYAIKGEAYRPSKADWKLLDRLEGHPDMYKRVLVDIKLVDGDTPNKAWIYLFTSPMMGDLAPGRWAEEWNPKASYKLRDRG